MIKNKKTFYNLKCNKINYLSQNRKAGLVKNIGMIKNPVKISAISKNFKMNKCKVLVMPPRISDEDITALFNGILNIVKKKVQLETEAQLLNANYNFEQLIKQLKRKEAECNRLKNEILYLKSKQNQS